MFTLIEFFFYRYFYHNNHNHHYNSLYQRFDEDFEHLGAATMKPRALIIDGPSLITAMADSDDGGCKELLLDFSNRCKSVVGCRVSPDQKREMVNLVKMGVPGVRTLAIGDGANDVAMIQEAHIGVGIRGEEGLQAANSSDYAIAQFRYLSELVLKHGRYNYIRMTTLVLYMFYKNIVMSMAQFWFNFNNAFSGMKYFTEGAIQMYNVIFTFLPIVLLGIYDMDVLPSTVHKNPQLYHSCIDNEYFKVNNFLCIDIHT
jgi:phospholipid-transporting ATPase